MAAMDESPYFWLTSGLNAMEIELSEVAIEGLLIYFAELKRWNKKINLIGPGSDKDIIESHFLDCLALINILPEGRTTTLLDVGSGAGFPGLVLKICRPDLDVTLVEPRQKRVSFLKHICRLTKSSAVQVVCQRLNENDQKFLNTYGTFSLITCRALSRISSFLRMVQPLLAVDGRVVCMKGPRAVEELAEWRKAGERDLTVLESRRFSLPFSQAERELVIFGQPTL